MKVAVFGWYGHDNAGDERIKFCLSSFLTELGGIDAVNFYDLHEEAIKGRTHKFDDYDLVIIGGGGLILSQHNYHDFILGINTKMATLGISVETDLKGNPKKFAQALLKKSSAFLVRDQGSYEKLRALDGSENVKVSSDLTFLVPYEVASVSSTDVLGINLFPKLFGSSHLLKVHFFMSRFLRVKPPLPVCFEKMVLSLESQYNLLPIPLYCEKKPKNIPLYQTNDVIFMRQYFQNTPDCFESNYLDLCSVFLSMRLHGLIFAAQKGIPFTTFASYPKQKNFVQEVGLSHLCIPMNQVKNTDQYLSEIYKNTEVIRNKILSYRLRACDQVRHDITKVMNTH